jgi:hypothetical protein
MQLPVLKGHIFFVSRLSLGFFSFSNKVKPVVRGHLWDKEKMAL